MARTVRFRSVLYPFPRNLEIKNLRFGPTVRASGNTARCTRTPHQSRAISMQRTPRHCRELSYLTESVYNVVLQQSIPAQIRQRILCISKNKGYADGFVRKLTFEKRLYEHFL